MMPERRAAIEAVLVALAEETDRTPFDACPPFLDEVTYSTLTGASEAIRDLLAEIDSDAVVNLVAAARELFRSESVTQESVDRLARALAAYDAQ